MTTRKRLTIECSNQIGGFAGVFLGYSFLQIPSFSAEGIDALTRISGISKGKNVDRKIQDPNKKHCCAAENISGPSNYTETPTSTGEAVSKVQWTSC